jgi:hypothetical protein
MTAYGGWSRVNSPDEANFAGAVTNFPAGRKIFIENRENLSIPVGEIIDIPIVLNMEMFSHYYVYFVVDQDVSVTIEWLNTGERGYVLEKTVLLPASAPEGGFLDGRVMSGKLKVRFTNNAIVDPGNDEITHIYVALFGSR